MKKIFSLIAALSIANAGMAQLYISSGATINLSGSVQVTLQNMNLVNDGMISVPGNSRFIFSGNNNNDISGTQKPVFGELEIAKTGSGLLTLQTDVDVKNKIVFTSGLIELDDHNIDLENTGFLEGENENSRITGINGGEILFTTALNAPSAANPGNLGAVLTSTQNLGTVVIHRGHQSQTNSIGGGKSIYRYFDITPANNAGLNATLRIQYFDAEKNSLDENMLEIFKSDDYVAWFNKGHSGRDGNLNYAEQTGINDFSRWTLSTTSVALPVTGLQLSGKWENNAVYLNWITLTEYHNKYFSIERKYNDTTDFVTVGKINSKYADGNSQIQTKYDWTDNAVSNKGIIQYRVRQSDMDGNYSYSNIIIIRPETLSAFIEGIFPNPVLKNQLYIKTGNSNVKKMQVLIYDIKGSLLFHKQLNYQSQWLTLPQMNAGNYKLSIRSGKYHWTGNFMKE